MLSSMLIWVRMETYSVGLDAEYALMAFRITHVMTVYFRNQTVMVMVMVLNSVMVMVLKSMMVQVDISDGGGQL